VCVCDTVCVCVCSVSVCPVVCAVWLGPESALGVCACWVCVCEVWLLIRQVK
jgi:hypothetical protein